MNKILAKTHQRKLMNLLNKVKGGDKLLTISEASGLSSINCKMLYYYIHTERLPLVIKYGRYLVKESDLEKFIKK